MVILVCFTMIYNLWLKSLWQIPLPETANHPDGWAFPSGHFHMSVIIWGWLAIQYRWMRPVVPVILLWNAWAIHHAGFHYVADLVGALGFGSLSLGLYTWLAKRKTFESKPALIGIILAAISLMLLVLIPEFHHKPYLWKSQGLLIGISLAWLYLIQHKISFVKDIRLNLVQLFVALIGCAVIIVLFLNAPEDNFSLVFLQGFMIGMWVCISQVFFVKRYQIATAGT